MKASSGSLNADAFVIPTAELISEHRDGRSISYATASPQPQRGTIPPMIDDVVREVSNLAMQDKYGRAAYYTGDVITRTNKPHGKGCMRWEVSGEIYDGSWYEGQRHGFGLTKFTNGNSHQGNYAKDRKSGPGTYKWKDGRIYQGNYVNDYREDLRGILSWKDGTKYEGQFVRGQRQGHGRMDFPNGVWYDGEFSQGKYEGVGTCRFEDGKTYKGQWKAGQFYGQGVLTDRNGNILYVGLWERDTPVTDR
jgi:hypothetical protein